MLLSVALALAAPDAAVVYLPEAPTTLDPLFAWSPVDQLVHSLVHERLFHPPPPARGGEPWSRLVAGWDQQGTEARLTLGRGHHWHDGHPVDAGDVCFTVDALVHPRTNAPSGPRARATLASCRVDPTDPLTAVLTLWGSHDARPALSVPIVPQHAYASPAVTGDPRVQAQPIGAGPYRFVGRSEAGLHLTAAWPGLPLHDLVLAPIGDPYVDALALIRSDAAATAWVPPLALPALRAAADIGLHPWDRLVAWSIALDTSAPPLDDGRVRQALDLLLDRQALRRRLAGGDDPSRDEQPWPFVTGPFAYGSPRASQGIDSPLRDVARARALLEQAGLTLDRHGQWQLPDGTPFALHLTVPTHHGVGPDGLASHLGWEGIDLTITAAGREEWVAGVWAGGHRGHADAVLLPRALHPDDDPSPWLHSRTEREGWANVFDFSDPEIDRLLALAREPGGDAAARQLHGRVADLRPHLFLFEERAWTAWRGPWRTWVPAPYDGWSRIDQWARD